jgi:hypothetical protein
MVKNYEVQRLQHDVDDFEEKVEVKKKGRKLQD